MNKDNGNIEGTLLNYNGNKEFTIYAVNESSRKSTKIRIISGILVIILMKYIK